MKLNVCKAIYEDVYRDIIRIPESHRYDRDKRKIKEGSVCKVTIGEVSTFAILRGYSDSVEPLIFIDERLRDELKVHEHDQIEVQLEQTSIIGQFRWAWNASEPAYRVAARMAFMSVILGFIGFVMGAFSLLIGAFGLLLSIFKL